MNAGLGLDVDRWRRSSWRNSDLARASEEKNKNYPFSVKNVENWKSGTDVPDAHFETLLSVLTDYEPDHVRDKWRSAIRWSRDSDAKRTREVRQRAYRIFKSGNGSSVITDFQPSQFQISAGLILSGFKNSALDAPLLVSHLFELGARPVVFERIHDLLHADKAFILDEVAMELDDSGLLSESWQLRRFIAKSIGAGFPGDKEVIERPLVQELRNFQSGSQLAPLLVGPVVDFAPDLAGKFLKSLPEQFRENPQLSWEFHRNIASLQETPSDTPLLPDFRGLYAEFEPPKSKQTLSDQLEFLLTTTDSRSGPAGRYGVALDMLRSVLENRSDMYVIEAIQELYKSRNEGVRWCSVKYVSEIYQRRVFSRAQNTSLARMMSKDNNPWVLRELCDFLATAAPDIEEQSREEILRNMHSTIMHHTRVGVPPEATLPSFLRLVYCWPSTLYLFRVDMV